MKGRVICLGKRARLLRKMRDGEVLATFSVRFGRKGMDTREGTFRVQRKGGRHYVSNTYHVEMPYPLFFSGGQAVHHSADFARNGYRAGSHGWANLRDLAGARALNAWAPIGTRVVVYRGRAGLGVALVGTAEGVAVARSGGGPSSAGSATQRSTRATKRGAVTTRSSCASLRGTGVRPASAANSAASPSCRGSGRWRSGSRAPPPEARRPRPPGGRR